MVRNSKKKLMTALVCLCTVFTALSSGCNGGAPTPRDRTFKEQEGASFGSGVAAENGFFQIQWDDYRKCLFLIDKNTMRIYGTTPYEYYIDPDEEGLGRVRMESPVIIDYIDPDGSGIKNALGSIEVSENGSTLAEKLDNGVKVTYFFNSLEISIPVLYILHDKSMEIRLDIQNIKENENKLYQVTIAPFFASCKNDAESYLFVPSGGGALMYCDEDSRAERTVSMEMYGSDQTETIDLDTTNEMAARLPVFGVVGGDSTLCGIITEGSELSVIEAQAGNSQIGYSSVAPTFRLRGSDSVKIAYVGKTQVVSRRFTSEMTGCETASVHYFPLNGNDADYVGMANTYRNYLIEAYGLSRTSQDKTLFVEFLGGALTKEVILGFSGTKVIKATSYGDVKSILTDMTVLTDSVAVLLSGFTDSGLDPGSAGGGFQPATAFGSKESFDALNQYCSEKGIPFAVDFDIVRFRKTGNGFRISGSAAKTASNIAAKKPVYSIALKNADSSRYNYRLLSRSRLDEAVRKLAVAAGDWKIDGVGLSSLSSVSYSDSVSSSYIARGGMPKQVAGLIDDLRGRGFTVMSSDAGEYAAVKSDYLWNTPSASNGNFEFDQDIPFYQIVFKGYKPLGGQPVNLAADPIKAWLDTMRGAGGIKFSVANTYDSDFLNSAQSALQASVYRGIEPMITDLVGRSRQYLTSVANRTIIRYSEISPGVGLTVFDDQSRVYVNYTDVDYDFGGGVVEKRNFLYVL